MERLKIRPFTTSDLDAVLEIEQSSFDFDAFSKRTFLNLFNKFSDLFIIAEADKKILGYMITLHMDHRGHIISIAIDPSFRHRGIGSALATFTFEKLKAYGAEIVDLEVRVTNKSGLNFWRNLGFFPLRVVHRFYGDGEDALRMRKNLLKIHT